MTALAFAGDFHSYHCACGWGVDVRGSTLADDPAASDAVRAHRGGCWLALTEPNTDEVDG